VGVPNQRDRLPSLPRAGAGESSGTAVRDCNPSTAVGSAVGEAGGATVLDDIAPRVAVAGVAMEGVESEHDQRERLERFRARALARGVNPVLYWAVRLVLVPAFLVYFRLRRIGSEHLPRSGPLLLVANHRSFLDPFVIGTLTRRPIYYVAKRELFRNRWQAWLLSALGAFPIDRGQGDEEAIATAREILARGDCVVIFPEGTRVRSGSLGAPRRGVGRLALESGAPVVPLAVIGTEGVRRGWRVRPRRVRIRCGAPLRFPTVSPNPSPALAAAVTERIWARVSLQWEWLGGVPSIRHEPARAHSGGVCREARAA
jgi:glycerol-3-phosphate dehydrogenase (NAD(P)+)